jgi:hypothetical protein
VTTFAIQANYKWGPDRKEHMLNIQGDDSIEFEMNLAWVRDNIQDIVSLGDLIVGGSVVTATMSPQGTTAVVVSELASGDTSLAIESDKWGKKFAYGHPDAPDLPDGRGKYILKYVTLKAGTEKKVWVDPAEGPRPCKPGAAKAKQIWVNE